MKNYSYVVKDVEALKEYLSSSLIITNALNSVAILIQVFSSQNDMTTLSRVTEVIKDALPVAIIAGSTSVGEIIDGLLETGTIVLSISFFDNTILKPIAISCTKGDEYRTGQNLIYNINDLGPDIAGVLVLGTPLSIDLTKLFKGMAEEKFDFPIFGGGAGVYNLNDSSLVFLGNDYFNQGVIAIAFLSKELHIFSKTFLGWRPLTKEMTITEIDGMLLKKVDGVCAFDMYNRYLDIQNDKYFFDNALEFPILVVRNGETIARVPFFADENGNIGFLADLELGEKFKIGYGDPETIMINSTDVQKDMCDFKPDAILLYACICRRFLMQNDVNLETQSFNSIAPTTGFYTYGEFFSSENRIHLLNSTIVVVGIREGDKINPSESIVAKSDSIEDSLVSDPFSNKHTRIISKLLHFIGVVSSELEETNNELKRISGLDKLTQLYNRLKLDEIIQNELNRSARYHTSLSVAILDLDKFKRVNDNFGHLAGDEVLIRVANVLKNSVRESDIVGRWGGEEFLVILPETSIENANIVAEKIRAAVDKEYFPTVKHITCSLGVTSYIKGDTRDKLLLRADMALYSAKNSGRNKVVSLGAEEALGFI